MEQKVWLTTSAPLYPNLYVFLVGHAGIGKSRTVGVAGAFVRELPEHHLAPTSVTMASLVDSLVEAKRSIINMPEPPHEYNSLFIIADELSAFMHTYEPELIGGLTTFYDAVPYAQHRRGKEIRIKLNSPQLSILSGSTPSNLVKFVPELAWDQGFMSRVIMIYSADRPIHDMFNLTPPTQPKEMIHDLQVINGLHGEFKWTQEYAGSIHKWRTGGCVPVPAHPKLVHYNSRRVAHLLKLSMVSCVDRGNILLLDQQDFSNGLAWLMEAECLMPEIFREGTIGADAKAMDDIANFINGGKPEHQIVNYARRLVPAHSVMRVLEIMERSGMIACTGTNPKTGLRSFKVNVP